MDVYSFRSFDSKVFQGFIAARKRSLGQGNMFTDVCLSTGEGLVPAAGGAWSLFQWGEVPGPGGCLVPGVGGCGDPPWRLLLWVVRILLECILVYIKAKAKILFVLFFLFNVNIYLDSLWTYQKWRHFRLRDNQNEPWHSNEGESESLLQSLLPLNKNSALIFLETHPRGISNLRARLVSVITAQVKKSKCWKTL